jgi:hypothetical protein
MATLETGVEWMADGVGRQEPLRDGAESGIGHRAYDFMKRRRVWMASTKGSSHTKNEPTDFSQNDDADQLIVNINRSREQMIRIVNIYELKTGETGERAARRLDWQIVIR